MRDALNTVPTWTMGAGFGGIISAINNLEFVQVVCCIGVLVGMIGTLYRMYLDYKVAKFKMEQEKEDDH